MKFAGFLSRRHLMLGAGALVAGCGATPSQDPLRISITGRGEGDARLLFRAAGIGTEGLKLHYSEFQGGNLVVEALNGGSLDYGGMSEIPPIFALGSPHRSFRQIAVMHGDVNNQVVLVPKGSKIETLEDLRGKRVGYVRATTTQYFLIKMLDSVGLSFADITPVALGVTDGAAAFSQGALDAWAIYGFPIQRAVATEGARVLRTALGFLSGNYIVVAHVDALKQPEKVAQIRQYLGLTRRAYDWAKANEAEWAGIVASDIGVPVEYVRDQFARKSASFELRPVTEAAIRSQQDVADTFAQTGVLAGAVDVRPLWDDSFNDILQGV